MTVKTEVSSSKLNNMLDKIKKIGKTALVAVVASGVTLFSASYFIEGKTIVIEKNTPTSNIQQVDRPSSARKGQYLDFSDVASKVTPAVVHIQSTVKDGGTAVLRSVPSPFDQFFGSPFRQYERVPQPSISSGSGVIINDEGYIVTNNHVVDEADELEVTLYDKRTYTAQVIGTDPSTDLALIKIDADQLQTIPFGNSDLVRVGEWVLAVGNPFNLESTVTAGIVSAKARNINILQNDAAIESFIQTDAAVNPGNSGGALVNEVGELVGINTAIASKTGSFSGYAFAVPSNIASKVIEDLINYGVVQRAFIGIGIAEVDSKLKKELDLSRNTGVLIKSLSENGAAKEAGLKEGDIIISIDGKPTNSVPELQEIIGRKRPGDIVKVGFDRKGKVKEVDMSLRNRSGNTEIVEKSAQLLSALGAELEVLDQKEARQYGLDHGIRVKKLGSGQMARNNIKEGFIITQVNDQPVKTLEAFNQAIANSQKGLQLSGTYPGSKYMHYYSFDMR